jgi:hypothetical protein
LLKRARLFLLFSAYGLLCNVQKTAICSAVFWRGVWQVTSAGDPTRGRYGHLVDYEVFTVASFLRKSKSLCFYAEKW